MNKKRPTIGFLTCHLDNDYAFEICKGVEFAAEQADVNMVILPGMYLNASYNDPENAKYDYQYNSIFYYANKKSLDALIVSIGSIGSFISIDDKKAFLDSFDVPVITIEIEVPGYPCLYTEGRTGMKECIEHLIKHHGKTKIGFVSGRLENADALDRFNIYKEVLNENGIEFEEKKVAYGNFSEFTEDIVGKLLDDNPDLEAIVFANDTMAIGGYKAIKKRGLSIGSDILVTGVDNAPTALGLIPQLTTVDNNIMELGYNSVFQALELLKTGKTSKSILNSRLITRLSCGCNPAEDEDLIFEISSHLTDFTSEKLINRFKELFLQESLNSFYAPQIMRLLDPYFLFFADIICKNKKTDDDELRQMIEHILDNEMITYYFSHSKMTYVTQILSDFLIKLVPDELIKEELTHAFNVAFSFLSFYISQEFVDQIKKNKEDAWTTLYITRDALSFGSDNEKCFKLLLEKLYFSGGFRTAYLYLYDELPAQLANGQWRIPTYVNLQAYVKYGKATVLKDDDRMLPSYMIFNHKSTPNERRHTMVLTPLFTNDIQYGLLLCETNLSNFSAIYRSTLQLGTSLKFMSIMKQELAIQHKLEQTMDEIYEKNDQLNTMYITDELTSLYNRRGFFEAIEDYTSDPYHLGEEAIVGYIDMDNLKQVNDYFGHSDGDFALKSIAAILKDSCPENSIVARIGGDEYAVMIPKSDINTLQKITEKLDEGQKKLNEESDTLYYIEFSYGFRTFTIVHTTNFETELTFADRALYINKKEKRSDVRKNAPLE